jgi:hypothetical protein
MYCVATTTAVICIDLTLQSLTPFDITSLALWGIFPIGTISMVALALSGFFLAGRTDRFEAQKPDLFGLFVISLLLLLMPYLWSYFLAVRHSPTGLDFGTFFVRSVTETQYRFYMKNLGDASPVKAGDAGWFLAIIRIASALAMARVIWGESRKTIWRR